jgi:hypothetical protein
MLHTVPPISSLGWYLAIANLRLAQQEQDLRAYYNELWG